MKTITKEEQQKITPLEAIELLKKGNERFIKNLQMNRNLLQQVNETTSGQNPFAVIISCMDSRTSAELIFDQGLGDIFSIRIAGNIINEDILGSTEFACKLVGSKVVVVLGHTNCGAVKGAINHVELGHLHFVTNKIQRSIPFIKEKMPSLHQDSEEQFSYEVTKQNVIQSMIDLKTQSSIISDMVYKNEIQIVGGIYDVATGKVDFFDHHFE